MSVREEQVKKDEKRENESSSGLKVAVVAAAVVVGAGAALYYFLKKEEPNSGAGSSSSHQWQSQNALPVNEVAPSVKELNNYKTQIFRERSWSLEECSICFEIMLKDHIKTLSCGHKFHGNCVESWLREHKTCPNCRKAV